jgi:hypothetical protein
MQSLAIPFRFLLVALCVANALAIESGTALAAIWEDEDELIQRYGDDYRTSAPDAASRRLIAPAEKTMLWSNLPDYEVYAYLIHEHSLCEMYTLKRDIASRDDRVVAKLLADNADGDEWVPLPDAVLPGWNVTESMLGRPECKYVWKQKKGSRRAVVPKENPKRLIISSEQWRDALEKK